MSLISHQSRGSLWLHSANLDLAVTGLFSYRIPGSGMEGCFNDHCNSRLVTLHQWTPNTANFESARLLKPVLPSFRDNVERSCLPIVRVSIELSAPPFSSGYHPSPSPKRVSWGGGGGGALSPVSGQLGERGWHVIPIGWPAIGCNFHWLTQFYCSASITFKVPQMVNMGH